MQRTQYVSLGTGKIVPVYFTTERIGIAIDFEVYDFAQSIPASVFPGLAL